MWINDPTLVIRVNWVYKFIKCHPALHIRYNQRISYQQAKQEDLKIIKQWFKLMYATIQEHGIHKDNIWNFNETSFAMGLYTTLKVITIVDYSERPYTVIQGNCEWVIIIKCMSLKGIPIPPVVILKGKEH
jgi:hypothetical protein